MPACGITAIPAVSAMWQIFTQAVTPPTHSTSGWSMSATLWFTA